MAGFFSVAQTAIILTLLSITLTGCIAEPQVHTNSTPFTASALTDTSVPGAVAPVTATSLATATAPSLPTTTPLPSPAVTASPRPSPTVLSATSRQQLFEEVWRTVDENYLYRDFRGLDWQMVRNEFEPQVAAIQTDAEFYTLLSNMVERLNDQHSRFLAPQAAEEEDVFSSGHEEQVGIGVIMVPATDGAMIQIVFPDSPADHAGLRPRDRIVAVDGAPYNTIGDIQGPEGSQVRLTIIRPEEETRDVVLTRRHVEGRIEPFARRLAGDIGYLRITTLWVNDMDQQVSSELETLVAQRPLKGLILDLRGNPGGWRNVLTGILSHFVRGNVGVFFDKHQETPMVIETSRNPDLRGVPLAALIDNRTASYAELLAGILQVETGAYVIGAPSSGNTETIYAYELMGGSRLWVAQEGFRLGNGVNLEGHGVQPDTLNNLDWTRFSEDNDPGILTALQALDNRPAVGGE
ncbi:MAG: S41 family peptidase [Chloroflexales bacterium]|nr:S41 family peptidase [Chloroflexales bacterium]